MVNDGSEMKYESVKFETVCTIDQSSDVIGIDHQQTRDRVTVWKF